MNKHVKSLFAVLLVTAGMLVVFGSRQPQTVSAAPAAGTIAYVVVDDTGGDQVWLIGSDASNPRHIYSVGKADPYQVHSISALVWRPDAGELVFASDHEDYCSWYASDLYAIQPDGSGYRRVTNAPACAALSGYPKGKVTVVAGAGNQVYVMGAPMLQFSYGGTVVFDDVADLGDTVQPVVAIDGNYRWMGSAVDVKANQTVDGGSISGWGTDEIGAFKPSWRSDGSRVGYAFGCARLYAIQDRAADGNWGQPLATTTGVTPCIMAYGPASAANQIVYFTDTGGRGIYRTTENSSNAGIQLIAFNEYDRVLDLEYLPDGSGFLYTSTDNWGDASNIYRYDFGSGAKTQLTHFTRDEYARDLALSPDGQTVVFEHATHDWTSLYGGPSDLWMIGLDGSNSRLFKSSAAHPTWTGQTPHTTPPPQSPPSPTGAYNLFLPFIKR